MNKRLLSLAVAGIMVLGLAGVASAGIPDETKCLASASASTVLITPSGQGYSLASQGATVTVTVYDSNTDPVVGFPFQDVYLDGFVGSDITLCNGGSTADGNTNGQGITTISGLIYGGGFTAKTNVYVSGAGIAGAGLDVRLNSPDITGDLLVNTLDFGTFGTDFGKAVPDPLYNFRSDYVFDSAVNLLDFGLFGESFQVESCP
jgi:hypothetical protein